MSTRKCSGSRWTTSRILLDGVRLRSPTANSSLTKGGGPRIRIGPVTWSGHGRRSTGRAHGRDFAPEVLAAPAGAGALSGPVVAAEPTPGAQTHTGRPRESGGG